MIAQPCLIHKGIEVTMIGSKIILYGIVLQTQWKGYYTCLTTTFKYNSKVIVNIMDFSSQKCVLATRQYNFESHQNYFIKKKINIRLLMPFSIGRFLVHFSYIWVKIAKSHFIGQISQTALNQKAVFEVKYS